MKKVFGLAWHTMKYGASAEVSWFTLNPTCGRNSRGVNSPPSLQQVPSERIAQFRFILNILCTLLHSLKCGLINSKKKLWITLLSTWMTANHWPIGNCFAAPKQFHMNKGPFMWWIHVICHLATLAINSSSRGIHCLSSAEKKRLAVFILLSVAKHVEEQEL